MKRCWALWLLAGIRTASALLVGNRSVAIVPARDDNAQRATLSANVSAAWWKRAALWYDWEDEDANSTSLNIVSGFTDCARQSPPDDELRANHAWWEARSGHHRPGRSCQPNDRTDSCSKPVRVPAVNKLGFCWVTKNGCSFWKALFMRMADNPYWNSPDIMDVHREGNKLLVEDAGILKAPSGLVVMVVRNPVARVLSAWLDKRRDPNFRHVFDKFPAATYSFAKFIEMITPEVAQHRANRHWARQVDQCSIGYGAEYDIYLKAECRTLWGPSLFEHKGMNAWTDSGWGPHGNEPFVRDDRRKVRQNDSRPLARVPSTKTKGSMKQGHSTGASSLWKVCKYYTPKLFSDVTRLFAEDIRKFDYAGDCERIAAHCGF